MGLVCVGERSLSFGAGVDWTGRLGFRIGTNLVLERIGLDSGGLAGSGG